MQFCVTAFEFSVADSVCGVRKMLPLVWSTDVTIKDAIIQAYRRLYLNPHGDNTRYANILVCSRLKEYNLIYCSSNGFLCLSIRAKAQTLVDNLSELMVDASLGTVQCLEEIVSFFSPSFKQSLPHFILLTVVVVFFLVQVQEFFSNESALQTSVVQVLWERFSGKREAKALHRRAAVLLLGMAAR